MDLANINLESIRAVLRGLEYHALNGLNSSPVLSPGGTATNFGMSAFSYRVDGVHANKAANTNIAAPGASTSAGEFRKILISGNAAGTITATAGAIAASQALAALPTLPADNVPLAYLELPASFTSGTTDVTAGMCVNWTETVGNRNADA